MSGSTTTPNLGLKKPVYDSDEEQWGYDLNSNSDILDAVLATTTAGTFVPLAGGTMTGPLVLNGNATAPLNPVTLQQLNAAAGVTSWNARTGAVSMTLADVTGVGGAPLASPAFTGTPSGPTAPALTATTQLATTAFVTNAVQGATVGVSSFNSRQGAVTLTTADVTGAGGAPTVTPVFTGNPTAPTPVAGNNTQSLATTAFVTNALAATSLVSSFNGRTGAITLATADVTGAGGAPQNSPALTGTPTVPTAAPGTATTQAASTAFVQAAAAPTATNTGRNYLHNGLMNVAQRGAGSFTSFGYTADRWGAAVSTDAISVNIVSVAPGGIAGDEAARFSLNNNFTGNAAAGAYNLLYQSIENVVRLSGKTVTVSFYAYSNPAALKLGVNLTQNFGTGGSPSAGVNVAGQSVTLTGAWARYNLTFTLPSVAGKTLGTNGNDSTGLQIWYSAGSSNTAPSGNVGVQTGAVALWGVQLELGGTATPLEKLDPRVDLANAQRFYINGDISAAGYLSSGVAVWVSMTLAVQMRAAPTIAVGAATSNAGLAASTFSAMNNRTIQWQSSSSGTGQYSYQNNWSASADL
jgi:hypothetical protein